VSVFKVLTEFKFEVGSALANTDQLQGAVGSLSQAADSALLSFQKLSMGIVGYMGLGTSSLLSFMQSAIQASEKFGQAQRDLSNVFLSNNLYQGANAFHDSMLQSEKTLERINTKARQFSLPAAEMVQFTKLIGATLISHGLDDASLKKSIDISRGFLKSAPILGIDPNLAQGQLLDAAMGRANLGDTLFQRLMNETAAMKQFKGNPKGFNALPDAKRIEVLTKSLTQFGDVADVVTGNARALTNQLVVFRETISGMFSIFKNIGTVLVEFIRRPLIRLNQFLALEGKMIADNISKFIESFIKNPTQMYTMLKQMAGLKADLTLAGKISLIIAAVTGLTWALKFFGIQIAVTQIAMMGLSKLWMGVTLALAGMKNVLLMLTGAKGVMSALMVIGRGAMALVGIYIGPLLAIIAVLQLFRRAIAIAQVNDAKAFAEMLPRLTGAINKAKDLFFKVFQPLLDAFDYMAGSIAVMFQFSHWLEGLIYVVEALTDGFAVLFGTMQGVVWGVMQLIQNVVNLVTGQGGLNIFKDVGAEFMRGFSDIWDSLDADMQQGKAVVNQTTNIGTVTIANNFKEQLEPDRIAFTLKEQLMKTAQNPNSSGVKNLSGALVGR
jgi:hypothetical protein